jgi:hypothetical protein
MEQAERMVKRSRIELAPGQKGDNVASSSGPWRPSKHYGCYIGQKWQQLHTGDQTILKGANSRTEFKLCPKKLLLMNDLNCTKLISLRETVVFGSQCGGQGYIKLCRVQKMSDKQMQMLQSKLK